MKVTTTYDDTLYQLVPKEPTEIWCDGLLMSGYFGAFATKRVQLRHCKNLISAVIACSPRIPISPAQPAYPPDDGPLTDDQIAEIRRTAKTRAQLASAEFEVWQGDEMCASTSGPREDALREAMYYASVYRLDGPAKVYEVTRTEVKIE